MPVTNASFTRSNVSSAQKTFVLHLGLMTSNCHQCGKMLQLFQFHSHLCDLIVFLKSTPYPGQPVSAQIVSLLHPINAMSRKTVVACKGLSTMFTRIILQSQVCHMISFRSGNVKCWRKSIPFCDDLQSRLQLKTVHQYPTVCTIPSNYLHTTGQCLFS